jgi:hypothetical protein
MDANATSENPTLTFTRNQTYLFDVLAPGNPFAIHTLPGVTAASARYTTGVSGAGATSGLVAFVVPNTAPNQLWYQSETNFAMFGRIDIVPTVGQPDTPPTLPPTSPQKATRATAGLDTHMNATNTTDRQLLPRWPIRIECFHPSVRRGKEFRSCGFGARVTFHPLDA